MDEETTNNSNGIADSEATAPLPENGSPAAAESAPVTTPPERPALTGEKVLDIVFGVAVIAGEAVDKAAQRLSERAKEMQDQGPAFWDTAEERGRPVRERLVSTLKGSGGGSVPATNGTETTASGLADSLRNLGRDIGITVGGGNSRLSAEEEIRTLEDRVRELEQVVVSGKTGAEPELPVLPEMTVTPEVTETVQVSDNAPVTTETDSETTTAESSSYAFGVDQHEDILAASPYAVSETDDERALEASATATDVEPTPEAETAPPASGRANRKKQRDFDGEATDENAPAPSPEA